MMQPGTRVRVTNHNEFTISDRYDGVPEVFEPGKPRDMDLEAAAHILGFALDENGVVVGYEPDMAYICRRWGWNLPTFGLPKSPEGKQVIDAERAMENARKAFENLTIELVRYNVVEVVGSEQLPPARTSANKGGPIRVKDKPKKSGMSEEQRAAAGERMRQYWAKKRAAEDGGPDQGTAGAAA